MKVGQSNWKKACFLPTKANANVVAYRKWNWCGSVGLEDALCKRVMIAPDEIVKRSLDPISAAVNRDGLAKTIYSRLFIGVKLFYKRG
ncbi:putative P-loop containing nucleoside triphosphate hydrolase [Helianthus anomalus]